MIPDFGLNGALEYAVVAAYANNVHELQALCEKPRGGRNTYHGFVRETLPQNSKGEAPPPLFRVLPML